MNLKKDNNMENPVAEEIYSSAETQIPDETYLPNENKFKKFFLNLGQKIYDAPLWQKVLLVAACCTLDYFTCFLLLIGTAIFMYSGNKGLAIALALCNILFPDNLPVIDEAFTVLAVLIPVIIEYNRTGSIKLAVDSARKSKKDFKKNKKDTKNAFNSLIKEKSENNSADEEKNLL